MLKLSENNSENSSGDEDVMEDWSTSYFLSQLSPLFLLFSDRFLPVRPMFCVCFVLLWPSVLLVFSVLSLFLRLCFCLWSLVQCSLCLLCVRSSLFFLGFFRSFVRPLCVCLFFPCFFFSPVRPQFVPPDVFCVFRSPDVFCSWVFSVLFVLSVRPLVFLLFVLSSSSPFLLEAFLSLAL